MVVRIINTKTYGFILPIHGRKFSFDKESDIYVAVKSEKGCTSCALSDKAEKCVFMDCMHDGIRFIKHVQKL